MLNPAEVTRRILALTDIGPAALPRGAEASPNVVSILPVPDPIQALELLRSGAYDAVSVSLPVAGWTAEELLEEIQRARRDIPVVFLGDLAPSEVVRLVRLGAHQVLPANATAVDIAASLSPASASADAPTAQSTEPWRRYLVGESQAIQGVVDTIRLVSSRRCTVLITGETGTGKEMAARAIHAASNRADLPLVAVNCNAIPETLLEDELFGHVKGSFTGASQNRKGRFEDAHQGTLFLDEIGELPLDLQTKLLRVLQEREIQRLGSSETIKVDVRMLAACNIDLHEKVRQGKFREDLFYRLNVVPIVMPPLRERASDVPLLAGHFMAKLCEHEGIPMKRIASETMERLCRFHWPGNVRQLENAIEAAVAMTGTREILFPGDFPLPSILLQKVAPSPVPTHIAVPQDGLDFEAVVHNIERGILAQALRMSNGNKKAAADLLRLKRTTLTAKLKALEAAGSAV